MHVHSRDVRELGRVKKTQAQASSCKHPLEARKPSDYRNQKRFQAVLGLNGPLLCRT